MSCVSFVLPFTFTMYDGSIETFDLPLENAVKNGYYDEMSKNLVLVLMNNTELVETINKILIEGIKWDTLNGRNKIYSDLIVKSFDYPILGHGVYFPFTYDIDLQTDNGYQWGHCTFLHALFTTGLFGTLLLTYHMIEKYFGLIRKIDIKKFTLLFSFALSGLYGLFDVSYFYINYMIVFIVILILADDYIERLVNFKFIDKYAS